MSIYSSSNPVTISTLNEMKSRGEKIACLTAYDATFSALESLNGIEVILVGDSLGMILQGHDSTLPVTMEDILYHLESVKRTNHGSMIMADMPIMQEMKSGHSDINAASPFDMVENLEAADAPLDGHVGDAALARSARGIRRTLRRPRAARRAAATRRLAADVPAVLARRARPAPEREQRVAPQRVAATANARLHTRRASLARRSTLFATQKVGL